MESLFTAESPSYSENPAIEEVLENNEDVVTAVNKNLNVIGSHMERPINRTEAGYIAVHVCAAIERKKNKDEVYIRVGNKIDTLRNSRHLPSRVGEQKMTARGLAERLEPVVEYFVQENSALLMKEIRKIVRDYFNQTVEAEAGIFAPYLHHLLPSTHIELDVECTDWRDAVRKAAGRLLKLQYIEERYIIAMIKNIEENGPYIVLSKGFAVPHEGLEQGSIKVGMSLIRLKEPVPFGEKELDPVEFVCCLSAVDHKTHLKAFFHLVNMLKDEEFKQQLHNCHTAGEAAHIIEKYEYEIEE